MKKDVIAYIHTHWDREWYREFEVFRLRLLRVFDNILDLLEKKEIPCFYFDGQTSALQDYLEMNPEKEPLVRKLIKEKKLFIGPCYTLVDEFLTDGICFRKNLEIGLKYAKELGCQDFIGYFADTFGHSKNVPAILKEFNIDKAIVWRGCGENVPSEFLFNGVKTANLIRGYFMDTFSNDLPAESKAKSIEDHLDKIAENSSDTLLLPIGADHLGVDSDIAKQIKEINKHLKNYEIKLSSPFEYFERVKANFKFEHNEELRDNSNTFILPGSYSARIKLKQYNTECSYKLDLANKFHLFSQKKYKTKSYDNVIEYAYKLLLQNQAHDGICGCSTDLVHQENIVRYEKVLQIANTIIEELTYEIGRTPLIVNLSEHEFSGIVEFESLEKIPSKAFQLISKRIGFDRELLNDTKKIPITEDYKTIYTYLTEIENKAPSKALAKNKKVTIGNLSDSDLTISKTTLENSKILFEIKGQKIQITDKISNEIYSDFMGFIDFKDNGDTYNFGPVKEDKGIKSKIISSKILKTGKLQCTLAVKFEIANTFLNTEISLKKDCSLLNFKINWKNKSKNHLLQVQFNLKQEITKTFSEDMGTLIERDFDPNYDIRKNLPKNKGIEAKTNTAPMQRYVNTQGFGVVTNGLCEYEVKKHSLLITLLRAVGVISNPKNPARSTPAGPPIEVIGAQQLGANMVEFSIGFNNIEDWKCTIDKQYPYIILSNRLTKGRIETNNKFAFTLTEVLITLLIMAIIFVLTLPMLMVQVQNSEFKTTYKKSYSIANQAWQEATADNDIKQRFGGWCDNTTNNANFDVIKSKFQINKDCGLANPTTVGCWASGGDNFNTAPNATVNSFIDSSGVSWAGGGAICGAIILDVNGLKTPNQFGRDRFALIMGENTTQAKLDRINPWADQTAINANECPKGSCFYTTWLFE